MDLFKCLIQPISYVFRRPAKEKPQPAEVNAQHSDVKTPALSITNGGGSTDSKPIDGPPRIAISTEPLQEGYVAPLTPNRLTPTHSSRRDSNASSHRSHDVNISRSSCSRSNSKNSTMSGSLKEQLRSARMECPRNSYQFIVPKCDQESLITVPTITKAIQAGNPSIDPAEAAECAEKTARSAKQLFSILAWMKREAEICSLLKEGVSDKDLPLSRGPNDQGLFALQKKTGEAIKTLDEWGSKDQEKFGRVQWWMIAPVFEDKGHYELDDNAILPFIPFESNAETRESKQGGYSEVYPVCVHPAHHRFWSCPDTENGQPLVAVKKLLFSDETEFQKEVTILKALGSKRDPHPHLIKLLATYRHEKKYHLMFPYANANLRKYWEDRPSPSFDEATVLWSLKQMTGIASGLSLIHNFKVTIPLTVSGAGQIRVQKDAKLCVGKGEEIYGRHGDIKPENILWFEQIPEVEDEGGVLQIADFGLGRFHGRDSRSKVPPDTVLSSPTYEPPECKLGRPVSRAYDIWSLGCLYLEFITWLLMGSAQITDFSEFRGREASTGINDDNFFTITRGGLGNSPRAVVRDKVVHWVGRLHQHEKCTALIHNLLNLIMERLLVIDSKERIFAEQLHQQLNTHLDKAMEDRQYLLDPVPWPHNPGNAARPRSTLLALGPPRDLLRRREGTPGLSRTPDTWPSVGPDSR